MTKAILIIAATSIVAYNSYAQTTVVTTQENLVIKKLEIRERFVLGIKAGGNYSNVYDSQGEDFEADGKLGAVAGGFLSVPIGKLLGVQPEVLYSQKGFRATGSILGSTYSFTRTTSFIDVPIFMALKPSEFVTLLFGPQYSYLLTQKDVFKNATTSIEQEQEFENDNIRKNIFSLAGGVDINSNHMVLGVRGGIDVQNNNGNGSSNTPRYKNIWAQATIGYRLY